MIVVVQQGQRVGVALDDGKHLGGVQLPLGAFQDLDDLSEGLQPLAVQGISRRSPRSSQAGTVTAPSCEVKSTSGCSSVGLPS